LYRKCTESILTLTDIIGIPINSNIAVWQSVFYQIASLRLQYLEGQLSFGEYTVVAGRQRARKSLSVMCLIVSSSSIPGLSLRYGLSLLLARYVAELLALRYSRCVPSSPLLPPYKFANRTAYILCPRTRSGLCGLIRTSFILCPYY
jgi:hypothetical protein